jgi:phosphatidylethanolamine/phosphatidyl-N-methylethanolamine N-methyltransferase
MSVASFYDKFACIYPVVNLFLHKPKKELLSRVNAVPAGRLLEIGVGRGENLRAYRHESITGIDVSEGMLSFARKQAPPNCTLKVMNASSLEFPDASFENAVISHVLSVVPDPGKVMDEVHRVLVPGGRVFILNHESTGGWRASLDKAFAPVTRKLHFSALFRLDASYDHAKFSKVEESRYGLLPSITLMVLERHKDA